MAIRDNIQPDMSQTISAVFENGIFRPLQKIELNEGEEVEVIVLGKNAPTPDQSRIILDEIAQLPIEGPDDGFSGSDHDSILFS